MQAAPVEVIFGLDVWIPRAREDTPRGEGTSHVQGTHFQTLNSQRTSWLRLGASAWGRGPSLPSTLNLNAWGQQQPNSEDNEGGRLSQGRR